MKILVSVELLRGVFASVGSKRGTGIEYSRLTYSLGLHPGNLILLRNSPVSICSPLNLKTVLRHSLNLNDLMLMLHSELSESTRTVSSLPALITDF